MSDKVTRRERSTVTKLLYVHQERRILLEKYGGAGRMKEETTLQLMLNKMYWYLSTT